MTLSGTLRSMLWKFLYGFVVAVIAFSQGWVQVHNDPHAWTIASFLAGLGTSVLSFGKDFIGRVLIPMMMGAGGDV